MAYQSLEYAARSSQPHVCRKGRHLLRSSRQVVHTREKVPMCRTRGDAIQQQLRPEGLRDGGAARTPKAECET